MSWDELIGQEPAKRFLTSALTAGRVANGYLFEGPVGVGKRTGALLLAKILLCLDPPEPHRACGVCKSCRWLAASRGLLSEHPDLIPPLKHVGENKEALVSDHEPNLPLETMVYIAAQLHRAPREARKRVAIIPEAHRMCRGQAEAANAFLKTLEEPPPDSVVILTSSKPEALLETIISRTQGVRFRRLSREDITTGLGRHAQRGQEELELAAALSDGSLGRALDLLDGDLKRWRLAVMAALGKFSPKACPAFGLLLWQLADEEGQRLFDEAKEAGTADDLADEDEDDASTDDARDEAAKTAAGWKRHVFGRVLELCEVAFRDALVVAAGADDEHLMQRDQADLARKLAGQFGVDGCEKVLQFLRDAQRASGLYVRGDLVGRVLAGRMLESMQLVR